MEWKKREVELLPSEAFTMNSIGYTSPTTRYTQSTGSSGHGWPKSAKRGISDVGGDFTTAKVVEVNLPQGNFVPKATYSVGYNFTGTEYPVQLYQAVNRAFAEIPMPSDIYFAQKGTTAIARCIPTNPVADAGTFIGELKEGLPKLVGKELFKTKLKDYRKIGSEYLNVEFGIKPLISDLQKFGEATANAKSIIDQLHRDSGKNIRRKYTFPDERTTKWSIGPGLSVTAGGHTITPNIHYSATGAPLIVTTEVTTRTWFSGCFTYHVNLGSSALDNVNRVAAEARKLYGLELTPETVWNLAPWSWAVDWEGNIGDVLHNVSRFANDGLVMRYGYIMQEKTCKVDYNMGWQGRFKSAPQTNLQLSVTVQRKERRRATPFGFGFDMTALTGRQSAILGALGISRGPRHV